jgi:hypothetical protein
MPIPRPILSVHGEDVDLEIPRLRTGRASFLSEGLFDEWAGGDPEEEDLYEVEVTHERGLLIEPIVFSRLAPAAPQAWVDDEDTGPAVLPMERFVLALGWHLANADPENWRAVCEAARGWDSWTVEDLLTRVPPEWTPEPLLPDEDL